MTAPDALTPQDVAAVRDEAAAGKPVTVWFTAAAVGVPAGGSAKVVAVADPAVGDFVQVRPAGTRDTMYCAPNELTRTRPARGRATRAAGKVGRPGPPARSPAPGPAPGSAARSAPPAVADAPTAVASPATSTPAPTVPAPADSSGPVRAPRRPARGSGEIRLGLRATSDGEWSVEVVVGKERIVGPVPVAPADVAAAARSLPSTVGEAIESSLEGARQRQRARVEQLRAELDAAQRVLDELDT